MRTVNRNKLAEVIFPVASPRKLPCKAWGISARHCKTGGLMEGVEGAICSLEVCYAKKYRYLFDNVQDVLEKSYKGMYDPLWVPAAIHQIERNTHEENGYFRWFHSGDLQSVNHLRNILTIAEHTRHVIHWLPTRERDIVLACEIPDNLRIRASGMLLNGPAPSWWRMTSTVKTDQEPGENVCPAPENDSRCGDCRACVDPTVKNVIYRQS